MLHRLPLPSTELRRLEDVKIAPVFTNLQAHFVSSIFEACLSVYSSPRTE
jgi:hypothetical protein